MSPAIIYFAVTIVWPSSTAAPVVASVQFPDMATCEAQKGRALAVAVSIQEAFDYPRKGMRTFVACSDLKLSPQ
jgi:hypothetical protein